MQYIGREEPQGSLSTAVNQSLQKVLQHKLQKLEQRSELQRALGPNSPITIDQQLYLNSIAAHPELVDQTRKQFLIDNYQREQTAKRAGAATPPLVSNVQGSSVVPAPTAQPQGRGLPIGGNTQPISTPIQTAMGSALQAPTTQVATNTPVPPRLAGHALEDPSRPGKLMPTPYLTAHDRNANAIQAENMKFKREQATQKAESRAQDIKWREEGRTVEQQKQQFAQQNALEKSYEAPKKILETLAEKNTIDDEQLESMDIVDRFNKPGALFEGPFQGPLKGAIDKADYGDIITNTPTQIMDKAISRTIINKIKAIKTGGGRMTNALLRAVETGTTSLKNTPTALAVISSSERLAAERDKALNKAAQEVYNSYYLNGKRLPGDWLQRAAERAKPEIQQAFERSFDRINLALFKNEKGIASLPFGTVLDFNGQRFMKDKQLNDWKMISKEL